jgi:hypothetical protein
MQHAGAGKRFIEESCVFELPLLTVTGVMKVSAYCPVHSAMKARCSSSSSSSSNTYYTDCLPYCIKF